MEGNNRTVGRGFIVDKTTNLEELKAKIIGFIENFETQSGTSEERQAESVHSSLLLVFDRSNAPPVNPNNIMELPSI
jgi:hypothetical protein